MHALIEVWYATERQSLPNTAASVSLLSSGMRTTRQWQVRALLSSPLLLPLLLLTLPIHTDARVWGRVIHPPEVLAAVPEIHLQAQWLHAHREELPTITPALEPYWDNATVRPILEAVKRSPNPSYQIRKIDSQAIGWHRVYKRRQKKMSKHDPPPIANATAEHEEEERAGREEDDALFEYEYVDDESTSFLESLWEEKKAAAVAAAATVRAGASAAADPSTLLGPYMVFLLTSSPSDPFSLHLEALTTHLAPAFPHVLFLKGDGQQDFSGLTSQIRVKGLPQLLIFEEKLLRSRFKAKTKDLKSILNFLVLHTGALPQVVVGEGGREGGEGRFVVGLPRGEEGGSEEGREGGGMGWLYWVSAFYVLGEWLEDWLSKRRRSRRKRGKESTRK